MSNYRYEDDIRAGLDQAKAEAIEVVETIKSQLTALAETGAQLVEAFEHVTNPDDLLALSEDISIHALQTQQFARSWRRALDLDVKARRAEALIDQMRDERL
jgi:hypothetical protein